MKVYTNGTQYIQWLTVYFNAQLFSALYNYKFFKNNNKISTQTESHKLLKNYL